MRIEDVLLAPGLGGFFYDDQMAIRQGARRDGDAYWGNPMINGFDTVRMPASALSIGIVLDVGLVSWGDAMSVQYAGAAGRDPVFDVVEQTSVINEVVRPSLLERDLATFRAEADGIAAIRVNGDTLHVGLQYGLTQALLGAIAARDRMTMAEVICREYDLPLDMAPVPIYCQSGDARYVNVDRMIMKRVDSLPHGLFNSSTSFGERGELFLEYVRWVKGRIAELGGNDYQPTLHFDIYGSAGYAFELSIPAIVDYLLAVEEAATGFTVRIESPADFGSRSAQLEGFVELMAALRSRGCAIQLVADEWCNTLDDIEQFVASGAAHMVQIKMPDLGGLQQSIAAVGLCRSGGVLAYLGGSCAETDLSARISTHVAMATRADVQLAKPGMGVDEGLMIVRNEQARLMAELAGRR